jgi:hypothetical protein
MALGTPVGCGISNALTGAQSSGSFASSAGDAVYVFWIGYHASSIPSAAAISDTAGWSWSSEFAGIDTIGGARMRYQIWRAVSNGSSNDVTATPGTTAPQESGLGAVRISGANLFFQGDDGGDAAGDPAPSFTTAPSPDSTIIACFFSPDASLAPTAPGFTVLETDATGGTTRTFYDAGSPAQSAAFTSAGTIAAVLMVEVRAPRPMSYGTIVG